MATNSVGHDKAWTFIASEFNNWLYWARGASLFGDVNGLSKLTSLGVNLESTRFSTY